MVSSSISLAPRPAQSPSVLGIPHNSSNTSPEPNARLPFCPDARYMRAFCYEHGTTRYVPTPCKKRSCPYCGPLGRYKIASRIALGVRHFWPCAWHVLTFAEDVTKLRSGRRLSNYIKQLRKLQPGLQYAATYELTTNHRIHINLLIGPWQNVPQAQLQLIWGAIMWVEWVKDDLSIARETTKAENPDSLSNYVSKLEQCIPYGRRVSYSKGWPKLPPPEVRTPDFISWTPIRYDDEWQLFHEMRYGQLLRLPCGDYVPAPASIDDKTWCDCFPHDRGPPLVLYALPTL